MPLCDQNPRIQRPGSGLTFKIENNGKGSRAKIAPSVKHTCLSGCWNARVLGGIPGHTALPPRPQLSAILLCPVLLPGTWVRTMGNARPPPATWHPFSTLSKKVHTEKGTPWLWQG